MRTIIMDRKPAVIADAPLKGQLQPPLIHRFTLEVAVVAVPKDSEPVTTIVTLAPCVAVVMIASFLMVPAAASKV